MNNKTIILAEKPSVARDIARIVGADKKEEGYLSGNGYTVTWAIGHLCTHAMPEAYGYTRYNTEDLPIIPDPFLLTVRQIRGDKGYKDDPGAKKQLSVIKKLFSQSGNIVVATDAGREGELIFRFI
nr:toprim domain-containing protein [Petrimonas sp.]